jgi:hypothetical protein
MPATRLRAQLSDQELLRRRHARRPPPAAACPTRPPPLGRRRWRSARSRPGWGRSASSSGSATPACGHGPNRIQRAGGPSVNGSSVLWIQVQELTPGLVDAVAVVRRGQPAVFLAPRVEAVPGSLSRSNSWCRRRRRYARTSASAASRHAPVGAVLGPDRSLGALVHAHRPGARGCRLSRPCGAPAARSAWPACRDRSRRCPRCSPG